MNEQKIRLTLYADENKVVIGQIFHTDPIFIAGKPEEAKYSSTDGGSNWVEIKQQS